MERVICEGCGRPAPLDGSGPLCPACGKPLRRERACPWCLEFSPAGRFCRSCGCELPAPEWFGAARMLKDAGVDRFSLAARLRALDPQQLETLQRRYEEQRAVVLALADQARLCQRFLWQQTFAPELEHVLLRRLPLDTASLADLSRGPPGPFNDQAQLQDILEGSPLEENRMLAALALLRLGRTDPPLRSLAIDCLNGPAPLAQEAAVTLCHWRLLRSFGSWAGTTDDRRLLEVLRQALANPVLRLPAAAGCALLLKRHHFDPTDESASGAMRELWRLVAPSLIEGLDFPERDLSFSCALALEDEQRLFTALDADEAARRDAAREVLLRRGKALERTLADLSTATLREKLSWLRRLPLPLSPEPLKLLLEWVVKDSPELVREMLSFILSEPAHGYQQPALQTLDTFAREYGLAFLTAADLLNGLAWAVRQPPPPEQSWVRLPPRLDGSARGWLESATRAIAELSPADRNDLQGEGLHIWFWAATTADAEAVLDSWATDVEAGRRLFEKLSALDSHAQDMEGAALPPAWRLLFGIWDRAREEDRPQLAAAIAAGWHWGYRQDEPGTRAAVYERYRKYPLQRPLLKVAFSGLVTGRGESWEKLHAELAPAEEQGGEQPADTFCLLCRAAPASLYEHVVWVTKGMKFAHAPALARALFEALRGRRDTSTQLLPPAVAFARWLDEALVCAEPKLLRETLDVFEPGWQGLLQAITPPHDGAEEYYTKEKHEEVGEILSRVRTRLAQSKAGPEN